jgi:hypothetical protein
MKPVLKYFFAAILVLSMGSNCHYDTVQTQNFEPVGSFEEELAKCKKLKPIADHCDGYILKKSQLRGENQLKCQRAISAIRLSCLRQAVNVPNSDEFFKACTHNHAPSVQHCEFNSNYSPSPTRIESLFAYQEKCYLVAREFHKNGMETLETYELGPAPCSEYELSLLFSKPSPEKFSQPEGELRDAVLKEFSKKNHP